MKIYNLYSNSLNKIQLSPYPDSFASLNHLNLKHFVCDTSYQPSLMEFSNKLRETPSILWFTRGFLLLTTEYIRFTNCMLFKQRTKSALLLQILVQRDVIKSSFLYMKGYFHENVYDEMLVINVRNIFLFLNLWEYHIYRNKENIENIQY